MCTYSINITQFEMIFFLIRFLAGAVIWCRIYIFTHSQSCTKMMRLRCLHNTMPQVSQLLFSLFYMLLSLMPQPFYDSFSRWIFSQIRSRKGKSSFFCKLLFSSILEGTKWLKLLMQIFSPEKVTSTFNPDLQILLL
jgi:hypothetical protein